MQLLIRQIQGFAPDEAGFSAGKKLAKDGSFTKLYTDESGLLLFGECQGSGKNPYNVSVDFAGGGEPVCRCSCPSRKLPCKHAIGLMVCHAEGKAFTAMPIPQDILDKRAKLEKKATKAAAEKDDAAPKKPRTPNTAALKKKIASQLEGLALCEKLLSEIATGGMAGISPQKQKDLSDQSVKLGDYYIPGIQKEFRVLLACFEGMGQDPEAAYDAGMAQMLELGMLLKKGKSYLEKKAGDPALNLDSTTGIEAQLGHAWQLSELAGLGLCKKGCRLLQLSFFCYDNRAAMQYEDTGLWLGLDDGTVYLRQNFRPYKASKHILQEDTQEGVLPVEMLYVYPGGLNPRMRWEGASLSLAATPGDLERALSLAKTDYTAAVKEIKDQLKDPLSDKNPFALLAYSRIGMAGGGYCVESESGQRIELENAGGQDIPDTLWLLGHFKPDGPGAALCRFKLSPDTKKLTAAPLCLIDRKRMLRLAF
ncbi:MAG: SWIM zinc finger domain-containing protein [Clostridiales bacterium]|nr:SWIM zinc finger domain-containing protein [Clostridiales bacterium]